MTHSSPRQMFNKEISNALKEAGIEQATSSREEALEMVQTIAKFLGARIGFVTADDVAKYMLDTGIYDTYEELGNARGAIFRGPEWEWTGEFKNSVRMTRRANPVRV